MGVIKTSKQRAFLKSLAMKIEPSFNIGKENLSDGSFGALTEALIAHELVKVNVLKNSSDDLNDMARVLAENTSSEVVQIIGRKIVLYRPAPKKEDRKIILPKANKE